MPFSLSSSAALRHSLTMRPQVKMTASLPSASTLPLPTVKGMGSITGVARRARRRYTGPLISAAAFTA